MSWVLCQACLWMGGRWLCIGCWGRCVVLLILGCDSDSRALPPLESCTFRPALLVIALTPVAHSPIKVETPRRRHDTPLLVLWLAHPRQAGVHE
ncbi:hypothetical protein B0J15DRAFT_169294 [Fusarium solani]|uniref:Uncharacterized protein n=1 Tax=Fusarium solani TaxID=169388 RepID=A0A9P9RB00_FUSSL|nr:uncharacterized protein B0J15DRAFT_169294 [Fusarium solani]KAH7272184.1 hypothetical protein B0J15DRAFT_169294 [Fusarium solani]